ncbi:hypothetical protein [Mucilaginibacter ginsenosidivorax]|uniref:Uncharacterized protein n=1 Tax=Mucilaginibacter ginsenosidivorax TaxID=862126 RepID=A0A5B8VYL1_9SPHI|nr:hypothetical protein [Mucilaginibacter ginsenosidivorax]QEC76514.1 hypothetical protein FSB76_11355 [Mucilaginibacter ginsenosidivorax]
MRITSSLNEKKAITSEQAKIDLKRMLQVEHYFANAEKETQQFYLDIYRKIYRLRGTNENLIILLKTKIEKP